MWRIILNIIASLSFIVQKGIEIWQNYRAKQDGKNELLLEQEAMKREGEKSVEEIHRKLDGDTEYRQSTIEEIKRRAQ